ncbi:hypothetical protein [Burkholderia sp. WSM2230]|uniref:hypothetical protein n=1 Tax=Burkholderia sp. WSM2230 TaxID=944435 RepID=UPI0004716A37|nr:hypothetical protein [Burkholderia sp. WSM2230]
MELAPHPEQKKPRQRHRYLALISTATALALAYGVVRHLSWASSPVPDQQQFSVYVDRSQAPWERPVIAIREGVPAHISVQSNEPGVLMVHEIPGAFAACASGTQQSLDIVPVGITGRFSLHFHSGSGDQLEVATLEIYPR